MNKEQIKQYYERIEKLLNGANKETYAFVPEEIRQILKWYEVLQQENEQLKQMVNFGGITITNCPNCGEEITINFCRETEEYRQKYLKSIDQKGKFIDYLNGSILNYNVIANGIEDSDYKEEIMAKIRTFNEVLINFKHIIGDENNECK